MKNLTLLDYVTGRGFGKIAVRFSKFLGTSDAAGAAVNMNGLSAAFLGGMGAEALIDKAL